MEYFLDGFSLLRMMKQFPCVQVVARPTRADLDYVEDRLDAFNAASTEIFDGKLLSVVLKHPQGEIYAGLHGHTWGRCCEIKIIWIAETHRGQGIGSALLRWAERQAKIRGCRQIVVQTHSFQAPAFYEKAGFKKVATIDDYPAGHAHIVMVKQITQPSATTRIPFQRDL
jgi:GNAT superfamily N-acetyltransferase